ncbi:MAG: transporter substrate-binding domain-containing protein [Prolixibacteraceae bacterium]|nr:transporter substrate-binding domain-containing protein [Prolixibacteraceae bacterium]
MKNIFFLVTISIVTMAVLLSLNSCKKDIIDDLDDNTIQVSGIEFTPNFFEKEGEIVGIDADITSQALQNAGVEFEMSMSESWQSAYDATLEGSNKALVTTAFSPERKDLFKWAGPTSQGMYGIFENTAPGRRAFPLPIEECKQLPPIAVVKDWMETTILENMGFNNLTYYDTYNEALAAFMGDEIQFIASDFFHLTASLPSGYYINNVSAVTRYHTAYYYIAFSKDVNDAVVLNVQNAIESMIENQTTASVLNKYIPGMPVDYIPGTIQLFTELSPPFQYVTGRDTMIRIEGSSVDIVNEIQARTGHVNKINMSIWADAYSVVQYLPNSALFRTTRTTEREDMFQWVGPISTSRTYFYTLASSGLSIETLEQAKALQSIATPNGWFTHGFLINNNFQNIVATAPTPMDAFTQLINGEVQAFLMSDLDVKWYTDANDIPMSDLTQHMEALNLKDYIAFSLNTPESTVQQWQNHLDDMRADGTFETIWEKWFDGVPMP